MSATGDRLDILYLTHNYPRHRTDFAGRFIARLASLIVSEGRFAGLGVLAPHHPGSELSEEIDGVSIRRFRYAPDSSERLAYRGDWRGMSLTGPHGAMAHWRFFRAFSREARRLVADRKPRVIHAHWWVPAGWVARRFAPRLPVVVTLHGSDLRLLEAKPWMRLLAGRVFRRVAIITTVSSWLGKSVTRMFPDVGEKIRVPPMPPNDDDFFPGKEKPAANDPPVILCVTRFTAQKRNSLLLDVLSLLREEGRRFVCRLVGDGGSEKDAIRQRAEALGLGSHVEFVGAVDQRALSGEYRSADLTVLPAVGEGFGMALVEAQLCGCAVAGVRSGGITDIIDDGVTGYLAPPDDAVALAAVLRRGLANEQERQQVAQQGLESARCRFSSAAIARKFAGWYRGIM